MARSRSLWVPILIGVLAIVFAIGVLVGWNVIFTSYYMLATRKVGMPDLGAGYWIILSIGSLFLVMVVVTLVLLLVGNVRQTLYVDRQKTFIDSVTHELKSPLASLMVSLETMEQRQLTPELQARFLGMMKKDVQRLRTFIEHVLDAGRIEHGKRELRLEPVDCATTLEQCAQRIREQHGLGPEAIRVEASCAPASALLVDRIAVETIVLNLLDNAAKYSEHEVRIQIGASYQQGRLRIVVEDKGIGMEAHELKKVFKRFYRGKHAGGSARGTGLGLYLVDALSSRMGGRVAASSAGPGKGSRFEVELPCRLQEPQEKRETGGER